MKSESTPHEETPEELDERLDEALEETFPASDPVAVHHEDTAPAADGGKPAPAPKSRSR
jgi:hypothetical protein